MMMIRGKMRWGSSYPGYWQDGRFWAMPFGTASQAVPKGIQIVLGLFDSDRTWFANFNAAFAAEAFFSIHRNGFSILHFKHFDRANVHAFFATFTFFLINNGVESHNRILLS
jgi:hypothetical protein